MSKKNDCCEKIHRKGRFCKDCPLVAGLKNLKKMKKKQRKKLVRLLAEK